MSECYVVVKDLKLNGERSISIVGAGGSFKDAKDEFVFACLREDVFAMQNFDGITVGDSYEAYKKGSEDRLLIFLQRYDFNKLYAVLRYKVICTACNAFTKKYRDKGIRVDVKELSEEGFDEDFDDDFEDESVCIAMKFSKDGKDYYPNAEVFYDLAKMVNNLFLQYRMPEPGFSCVNVKSVIEKSCEACYLSIEAGMYENLQKEAVLSALKDGFLDTIVSA